MLVQCAIQAASALIARPNRLNNGHRMRTKRQLPKAFFLDGTGEGDDNKKGSTMLETKIENQRFTAAQGRIRPRSSGNVKVNSPKSTPKSAPKSSPKSSPLNDRVGPIMASARRPGRSCVAANDKDHSRLAMQAAKRMKSSKDKLRTGRLVCLHLRSLLTAAQSQDALPYRSDATLAIENRQYPLPM